ncbi:MAG: DUF3047 domain-containing protein [Candidatus Rokubacteria bacterium]|nr:DUF3047 domain-containing protein [Candidatus Rokubacteria bacterium]
MRRRRRRQFSRVGVTVGIGVTLAIVGLLLLSPRHRDYYSRLFGGAPPSAPSVGAPPSKATVVRPVPAPPASGAQPQPAPAPPARGGPQGFVTPIPPETGSRPLAGAAQPSHETREGRPPRQKQPAPPVSAPQAVAVVPRGGVGDHVVVKIVDEVPAKLPLAGTPPGWELKEFVGRAQVEVVRDEARVVFRLMSERTSFALYRDVVLDIKEFPLLRWSWKVTTLPTGGDIRERASDDQAVQVYVIFPRWPYPRVNSDVIGYIWDSQAPVGVRLTSPQSTNVKLVVLEGGMERLGQWVREERNVYQDYVELFGKDPPRVGKVALMIDSNDTRSQAEAFVGELVFLRAPGRSSGIPGPGALAVEARLNR